MTENLPQGSFARGGEGFVELHACRACFPHDIILQEHVLKAKPWHVIMGQEMYAFASRVSMLSTMFQL